MTNSATGARFGLLYRITPQGPPASVSSVYVCLYWPPMVAPNNAQGRCEIISKVAVP